MHLGTRAARRAAEKAARDLINNRGPRRRTRRDGRRTRTTRRRRHRRDCSRPATGSRGRGRPARRDRPGAGAGRRAALRRRLQRSHGGRMGRRRPDRAGLPASRQRTPTPVSGRVSGTRAPGRDGARAVSRARASAGRRGAAVARPGSTAATGSAAGALPRPVGPGSCTAADLHRQGHPKMLPNGSILWNHLGRGASATAPAGLTATGTAPAAPLVRGYQLCPSNPARDTFCAQRGRACGVLVSREGQRPGSTCRGFLPMGRRMRSSARARTTLRAGAAAVLNIALPSCGGCEQNLSPEVGPRRALGSSRSRCRP